MKEKEKILLIDGSSLIFRAFFAIKTLSTKDGISTNAVYGFLNMYRKAVDLIKPDYICVAFDRSGPTFRNKDYDAYKGNREKTPPELKYQFGILKDVLDSMNVVHIDMDEYEADDILGTISKMAERENIEAYMLTGDRDYFQLVTESSKVLYTKKGISELEVYDEDKIFERYEVKPKDLIQIKGLMGDASDNIPGVAGIGEKTAIKLIKEYKTIENIYQNIGNISGKKLKENLKNGEMQAYLSRKLGEIFTDVELNLEIKDFAFREVDKEKLYEKFKKLEFNTFIKDYEPSSSVNVVSYFAEISDTFDEIYENINFEKKFFIEIFHNEENYIENSPSFIAIKTVSNKIYIFDSNMQYLEFVKKMKEILENKDIELIGFDLKRFIYLTKILKINFSNKYHDLMIGCYLLDPSKSNYSISDMSFTYLDKEIKKEEDILGSGKFKISYENLEKEDFEKFVIDNIMSIDYSFDKIISKLRDFEMLSLYTDVEIPLVKVLVDMEYRGVRINSEELKQQDLELTNRVDILENKIYELAEIKFNINSPKQLGEILFEKMRLPVIKKTKTGYSTDSEVLDKLKSSSEIVQYIMEYRAIKKLKSTYIDGLFNYINDGYIHTIFKQTVTATGRISSVEPNLQNIPIRTQEGRKIRKAFVPSKNCILLSADYSQIELRVLAALSKDENMMLAFKNGLDIHSKTASEVFHVDLKDVTSSQRSEAKAVNFGIVYGISDFGLSKDLDIPRKVAKTYIDNYLKSYPQIKEYMENIVKKAKEDGYVDTILNRRRYVPELRSSNFNIRNFGERIALNTPIQGSAADIIKIAMIRVFDRLNNENLKSKIILQIHDELVLDVYFDELEIVKNILKEEMENSFDLGVKLIVDMYYGDTWYEI